MGISKIIKRLISNTDGPFLEQKEWLEEGRTCGGPDEIAVINVKMKLRITKSSESLVSKYCLDLHGIPITLDTFEQTTDNKCGLQDRFW